eukprot:1748205-Amphidinium_carterae.2
MATGSGLMRQPTNMSYGLLPRDTANTQVNPHLQQTEEETIPELLKWGGAELRLPASCESIAPWTAVL